MKKLISVIVTVSLVLSMAMTPVAAMQQEEVSENPSIVEDAEANVDSTESEVNPEENEMQTGEESEESQNELPVNEEPTEETPVEDSEEPQVVEIVLTPDSPFYFLKRFMESMRLLLAFDQEQKIALLDELAAERAKELESLQAKFNEGELTKEQLSTLEKALDELVLYSQRLVDEMAKLETVTSEPKDAEQSEEDSEDEDLEDSEEEDVEETEKNDILDKYQQRILHLQAIATKAPQAAQKGLARAISNAERQRERAIAKGHLVVEPTDDSDEADEAETLEEKVAKNKTEKNAKLNVQKNGKQKQGKKK